MARVSKASDLLAQAQEKFDALKADKLFEAEDALGGRIRIKHPSGLSVEGNEKAQYCVVSSGEPVAEGLGMVEAMNKCVAMAAPKPVQQKRAKSPKNTNPPTPPSKSIGQMKRDGDLKGKK